MAIVAIVAIVVIVVIVAIVDGRIRSGELAGACLLRVTSGGSFAIYINVWCF